MSADPRIVKNPIIWKELDYKVCAEFAIVWAKVLHPKTISPAQEKSIPVYIKNTFNPKAPWTKICKKKGKGLKWINIDDKQVLLNFVDPTMLWGYGQIYSALEILYKERVGVDVLGTTETSFSFSLKSKHFTPELKEKLLDLKKSFDIWIYEDVTKISLVWDSIDDFKFLADLKEDIIMVSTWAYWKLLTILVKTKDSKKLLKTLHKRIFNT
jgi:aspartate kinase